MLGFHTLRTLPYFTILAKTLLVPAEMYTHNQISADAHTSFTQYKSCIQTKCKYTKELTHEVAEYNLLHVHMYNNYVQYMHNMQALFVHFDVYILYIF